jgi:hypothetical protein
MITSCVDGYNDISIAYRIDISTHRRIMVSRDVILDEGMRYSSSQDSPLVIEENVGVIVPETNLEI